MIVFFIRDAMLIIMPIVQGIQVFNQWYYEKNKQYLIDWQSELLKLYQVVRDIAIGNQRTFLKRIH